MSGLAGEVRDVALTVRAGPRERRTILDIAALDLPPGRVTALSGPSGSGKSTLLYVLAGLLVPDRGSIRWGGIDLAVESEARRDRWRRENAGFVFQDFHLIEELSPLANVLAPSWFTRFSSRGLKARAETLLENFHAPRDARSISTLSRGEQQRVALARAMLFEPRAIFADEPTASLDADAAEIVADALRALAAKDGRTVIVASHDRAVLDRADEIIRIERGTPVLPTRKATAA